MTLSRRIFLDRADRLQRLAVASQELSRIAKRLRLRGVGVIDLSRVVGAREDVAERSATGTQSGFGSWQPASASEMAALREAASHWYEERFGVNLDPDQEITIAPNAIIGLTLLSLAFVEAGDMALLPDPGAPFYRGALAMAGGGTVLYHLSESNSWLPRFPAMEQSLIGRTRMLVLSHPHNPSTTIADVGFHEQAAHFCRRHQILAVCDAAFAHAVEDGHRPASFLSAPFATGVGVEMSALDSNFGIPGLSVALIAGNREAVSGINFLLKSGHWLPPSGMIHEATRTLLNGGTILARRVQRLAVSRRILLETVSEIGWKPRSSPTLPFLWVSVPARIGAEAFCRRMLRRTGLLMTPGTDFGDGGEGFIRIAIPEDAALAESAGERLRRHARAYQRRIPRKRLTLRERLGRPAESGE